MYISITGLRLLAPWKILKFYWYAIPSLNQARRAEGNILTQVKNIKGIRHTLTVWKDKRSMQAFAYSGAHLKSLKAFNTIADGKTLSYESNIIPNWKQARILWATKAKPYTKNIPK